MTDLNKFLILSHGRTGSTTLCNALSMHPQIHAYMEVFHEEVGGRDIVNGRTYADAEEGGKFCTDAVYKAPNEFGKRTVGFKLFFFHARHSDAEFTTWRCLADDPSIKIIFLLRTNLFDCYVSEQKSKKSGVWNLAPGEQPPVAHARPIFIDPVACDNYMAQTIAQIEWAQRTFQRHQNITLYYKDLESDFQKSLNSTFSFLGETELPIPLTFDKLNIVPHCEGVMNYEDLVRYFRHSIFNEFILPTS